MVAADSQEPQSETSETAEPSPAEESVAESEQASESEPADSSAPASESTGETAESQEAAPAETETSMASAETGADEEGLLPPPALPTDQQETAEATMSEEPADQAQADDAEATDEVASETSEPDAEAADQAEQPADTEEAAAEEEPTTQTAALPDASEETEEPGPAERFDSSLDDRQRRQVQLALQTLGYYAGAIDGIIGSGTRGGIAAYQRSIGATDDGFVGEELFAEFSALAPDVPEPEPAPSVAQPARTETQTARTTTRRMPSLAEALKAREAAAEEGSILGNDFEWLMRRALSGDRASQSLLASRYQRGQGAPLNLPEAVKWYRLAAEQGDPKGQYSLGLLYEAGNGVAQDYQEAALWFSRAAEQNVPGAREKLDALYARGLAEPPG